jgi:hypothetical protein
VISEYKSVMRDNIGVICESKGVIRESKGLMFIKRCDCDCKGVM